MFADDVMSLSSVLPKPSLTTYDPDVQAKYRQQQSQAGSSSGTIVKAGPPPYGHRKGWVPRSRFRSDSWLFLYGLSLTRSLSLLGPKKTSETVEHTQSAS